MSGSADYTEKMFEMTSRPCERMVCFRLQFFLKVFCVYRLIEKQVITGITIHRQLFLFHEELVAEKEFIFLSMIHLCFHDSSLFP